MKKMSIIIILFTGFLFAQTSSMFSLNMTDSESPDIILNNPATFGFINMPEALIGNQFLHPGVPNDNLNNSFLGYIHPVGYNTAIGLRISYFNSLIFNQGNYSLLFSRKIYQDILG